MVSVVRSLGLSGIKGYEVRVECGLSGGLPAFDIVGLPDAAVKEARDRVRSAVKHCNLKFPVSRVTVNLAPADTRKSGTVYDLPVLLGILSAAGQIKALPEDAAFMGELSLSGELRPVRGALSMARHAAKVGIKKLYLPIGNAAEAAFAENIEVYPVKDIPQLLEHLEGRESISPMAQPEIPKNMGVYLDFADVKGQENVKRALEIAAAGGHNILMSGPPGSGKSMLAKRIPSILPDMSKKEALDCTEVYSVMGLTSEREPVVTARPFRSPHHTVSSVAMSGGSSSLRPGEVSLAHNGVLFLDELPEFPSDVLEVLRQPLEDGQITVSRITGTVTYPSNFMLVCAMNPCKCGWYGHPSGRCTCAPGAVKKYLSKLSGPLLDRIDMFVQVPALEFDELTPAAKAEPSAAIKERVNAARALQQKRFAGDIECNAAMTSVQVTRYCELDDECTQLMRGAFDALHLTARSYDRILRVARTIADLDASERIMPHHLAEAIQYRTSDLMGSEGV